MQKQIERWKKTREEAINRIKILKPMINPPTDKQVGWLETWIYKEDIEALDMAIQALEQEPKTEWIPVSERLPEDRERVIFSTKTDRVFEGKYFDDKTDCQWYAFRDDTFVQNNVVTAWMPLPKPYSEVSE